MLFKIECLSLRSTFLRVGKSRKVLGQWDWMGKGFGVFLLLLYWFGVFFLLPCVRHCASQPAWEVLHVQKSCSQRQAPLWAPGPLGFCRARSQHHKGKTRHFASVKGTSSHISNIDALEAFHRDRMILLAFFPFSFWALLFSVLSCLRKERYKQGTTLRGAHSKTSTKPLEVYGILKKKA